MAHGDSSTPSAYAFNNDVFTGRETPLLKPKMKDEHLVSRLFRRRKQDKSEEGNVCPYCEFVNEDGAENCAQCYYSLNLAPRNQPMATPSTSGSDLMNTLLEDNEAQEDEAAVEAVLSLDDVAVEIDQYETTNPDQEDSFQFISGSTPELAQTVDFEAPEEVELSASDAPANPVVFDLGDQDPLDDVPEPVPSGIGSLYSPSVKTSKDEDLMGSVGPKVPEPAKTPELPNFNNLAQASHVDVEPAAAETVVATPQLPDMSSPSTPELPLVNTVANATATAVQTPDVPVVAQPAQAETTTSAVSTPDLPVVGQAAETKTAPVEETPQEVAAPTPQVSTRFWPWPAQEAWGAREVYREVVAILEAIKTGQYPKAAETLDSLGPHLDLNFEMLLHIGSAMRALNREEHLQWTLAMAKHVHPNNEHVVAAVEQLS